MRIKARNAQMAVINRVTFVPFGCEPVSYSSVKFECRAGQGQDMGEWLNSTTRVLVLFHSKDRDAYSIQMASQVISRDGFSVSEYTSCSPRAMQVVLGGMDLCIHACSGKMFNEEVGICH